MVINPPTEVVSFRLHCLWDDEWSNWIRPPAE